MTGLDQVAAAASRVKVFPLPSAVLFPHAALPLHIFEPRYRELVADCLATDQVMAVAQLGPGWEASYQGRPAIRPLLTLGLVAWHERLADGRYDLLLQGVSRARVLRELGPGKSYREFEVELVPELKYRGPEEDALRLALLELSARAPSPAVDGLLQAASREQGGALADVVASALIEDGERRQQLLEELDPQRRLIAALDDVSELLGRLPAARSPGPLN